MVNSRQSSSVMLLAAAACLGISLPAGAQTSASVRSVKVLGSNGAVEIEIEASERVAPRALVLTGPDRLVLDFPNAAPSHELRSHSVDRGDVKSVRVGLFSSNPPTTRIVVDLQGPVSYQLFPQGKSVIVKLGNDTAAKAAPQNPAAPGLVNLSYSVGSAKISAPPLKPLPSPLDVSFNRGMLKIHANRVSLSEVLFAVQQKTGAEIAIPAGAEQEKVAVDDGPAPAAEVLARLLNGSRFNFLILNSAADPRVLDKVVLSLRPEGSYTPSPVMTPTDEDEAVTMPPPRPVRGNPDGVVAVAQTDATQEEMPAAPNPNPANSGFPNARPTVVKTPDQENESPDY